MAEPVDASVEQLEPEAVQRIAVHGFHDDQPLPRHPRRFAEHRGRIVAMAQREQDERGVECAVAER